MYCTIELWDRNGTQTLSSTKTTQNEAFSSIQARRGLNQLVLWTHNHMLTFLFPLSDPVQFSFHHRSTSWVTLQIGHKFHGWSVGFEQWRNNYRSYLVLYNMKYWSSTLEEEQIEGVWEQNTQENSYNLYRSPVIKSMNKLRRMKWTGHVAGIRQVRSTCKVLFEKPDANRPLKI